MGAFHCKQQHDEEIHLPRKQHSQSSGGIMMETLLTDDVAASLLMTQKLLDPSPSFSSNEENDNGMLLSSSVTTQTEEGETTNKVQQQQHHQHHRNSKLRSVCYTLLLLLALTTLGLLPFLTYRAVTHEHPIQHTSYCVATFFVLLTLPISLHSIVEHLTNWYMPDIQKYVVRILWMVPIYSVQSLVSLRYHAATGYLDTFRDLYEALVISSFVYYLVALLGGEDAIGEILRRKDPNHGSHPGCLKYLCLRWNMGTEFLLQCKWGVLQYVVIKTVASILVVILRATNSYGEGTFTFHSGYVYIAIALNLSMSYAMYCLIKLFLATREDLRSPKNWHPIGKFLCIKGVVFFTFWQGFCIFVLRSAGLFDGGIGTWDAGGVASALQDVLVCVEMLGFAIAHKYTFTHREYMLHNNNGDGSRRKKSKRRRMNSTADVSGGIGGGCSRDDSGLTPATGIDDDTPTDETDNTDEENEEYYSTLPPTLRHLQQPMSVSRAFWSSSVPGETLRDIKRLGLNGATNLARKRENEELEGVGPRDGRVLFEMNQAESI